MDERNSALCMRGMRFIIYVFKYSIIEMRFDA